MAKNWIKGAIKHPGAFSAKAKKAGKSTHAFAEQHKNSSGTIGKQARLALTLSGMHGSGKSSPHTPGDKRSGKSKLQQVG